jgi:Arc/MetJ-type ribon-helix-helix transcriptional regulator
MQVVLNDELEKVIQDWLRTGRYTTPEDAVAAAILTLKQQDEPHFAPGELDKMLAEADGEIERGDVVDCEAFFTELLRRRDTGSSRP